MCRPPDGVVKTVAYIDVFPTSCRITLTAYVTTSYTYNYCPSRGCDCSFPNPAFGADCGTLYSADVWIFVDIAALSDPSILGTYLANAGLNSINTLYGALYLQITASRPVTWVPNLFPELRVIRRYPATQPTFFGFTLYVTAGPGGTYLAIAPGPGLANLTASSQIWIAPAEQTGTLSLPNLRFLSSLRCAKTTIDRDVRLPTLQGLDRVDDWVPTYNGFLLDRRFSVFDNPVTILSNVTALSTYARCRGNQRPDTDTGPNLQLRLAGCGSALISDWASLCAYIRDGSCPPV